MSKIDMLLDLDEMIEKSCNSRSGCQVPTIIDKSTKWQGDDPERDEGSLFYCFFNNS
jgi:hypothetical protein